MIFNQVVVGEHPAISGYKLNFFVSGFDDSFAAGSGQYTVSFPNFGIASIGFIGQESLFETGLGSMSDINILENEGIITGTLTGNLNNSGFLCAKILDLYSGATSTFSCDTINNSNRVVSTPISLETIQESGFTINIDSANISNRTNENLFYKIVPKDFLVPRSESVDTSGIMQGEIVATTEIRNVSEFRIQRETATDLTTSLASSVNVFPITSEPNQTTIIINSGVPSNYRANFMIKFEDGAGDVIFSGEGLPLSFSEGLLSQGITQSSILRTLTVPNLTNSNREFQISIGLNSNSEKTSINVTASA